MQGDDAGARLQRGMLRWVVLVIDSSKSSALEEVGKQLRLSVMVAAAKYDSSAVKRDEVSWGTDNKQVLCGCFS